MSSIMVGILGILCLFLLMTLRMQIGFALALVGFFGFSFLNSFGAGFGLLGLEPFQTASAYTLSVIPLFLLMGQFANHADLGADLYHAAFRWFGVLPGGLAMATIGACACFAAVSGSSLATAAMFGVTAFPEMKKLGYADTLSTGCIAAGGTLGILIPPSSVLILYGILTEQNIAKLFIAGVIPGLLLTAAFILTIYILTRSNLDMGPPGPAFSFRERIIGLKNTGGILVLFIMVIGGLYAGWFTPTEAAGVGACGALCLTIIKKRLTRKVFAAALKETTASTAMIFAILIGAMLFQYFMTLSRIPDALASWIVNQGFGQYTVITAIIAAFIILGFFMEGLSIMALAVPIVYPIVKQSGFDPIWFGVIITLTMEMSLITPPVGVNVFVLHGVIPEVPMEDVFKGVLPFWLAMLMVIIMLMVFPEVVLFLPNMMM